MVLNFYGKHIDDYEHKFLRPYVGFISPNGKLVDFNTEFKENHINFNNALAWTFLMAIKDSKQFEDLGLGSIPMNASMDMETGIITGASLPDEEYNTVTNIAMLRKDLLGLLKIMENCPSLAQKIRSNIYVDKLPDYIKNEGKILYDRNPEFPEIELLFGRDNARSLLFLLKDICISYIGYDSIEKIKPGGGYLPFDKSFAESNEETIFSRPRTITTTYANYHERFFNYLLMDWKVEHALRYIYDPEKNMFEPESMGVSFLSTDTDIDCAEELESIKKLVPIKDRIQFSR